jgi:hypothetical protein
MTHSMIGRFALATVLAVSLGAWDCGGDSTTTGNPDAPTGGGNPDAPTASGNYTHYATSTIKVGSKTADKDANGFDLDGDGHVNNVLGQLLILATSQGVDIDGAIATALTNGEFVILQSLHGDTTTAASATWQLYIGKAFVSPDKPNLTSGAGTFMIDTTKTAAAPLAGAVASGKFTTTTPGNLSLQLSLLEGSEPVTIALKSGRIEATLSSAGCSGKIGGGILLTDLNNTLIPALADQLNTRLATDVEVTCPTAGATCQAAKTAACCSSSNKTILGLFDMGCNGVGAGDYMITADELRCPAGLIATALQPDVDLVNAQGQPGTDGVADSVSVGVAFTCTPPLTTGATTGANGGFTASGEH